jgi:hypothetical protein
MNYRVKEFNSIYDPYFGKNKGWIYQSNEMSFLECLLFICYQKVIRQNKQTFHIDPIYKLCLPAHEL